jgi:hypothetical protein
VLDFGIPSGDGAGLVCVPFVTAKLFIAGAPWMKLAEIDIPGIQHWIQWKIGIKYILYYTAHVVRRRPSRRRKLDMPTDI